jgi:peptide/nickel transport system ATP-binding protein
LDSDIQEKGILSFRNFSVSFKAIEGKVRALDKINLTLESGTILGIIGESGSGKTTIALSALHLLPDNTEISGSLTYKGRSIYDIQDDYKVKVTRKTRRTLDERLIDIRWKEIAMVFQGAMNAFNPVRTIRNQIEEVFKVHGTFDDLTAFKEEDYVDQEMLRLKVHEEFIKKRKEDPHGTMESSEEEIFQQMLKNRLEIFRNGNLRLKRKLLITNRIERVSRIAGFNTSFLDSYPHELSGGMKQRGILAMALALFPSILVADEPTTGLDAISQAKIIKELKNLKLRKTVEAMVVISHDVGVISQLADRVAVMYAGRIMEYGLPDEIFNSPVNPYTYALVNSYPALSKEKKWIEGIPGHVPSLIDPPKGCYFANRCFMADSICFTTTPPVKTLTGGRITMCHFDNIKQDKINKTSGNELVAQNSKASQIETIVITKSLSKYFPVNSGLLTSLFGGSSKTMVHAVDNIDIEIKKGDIIGVVGESGSGKSTLGRLLVKSIDPSGGKLYFSISDIALSKKYTEQIKNTSNAGDNSVEGFDKMIDTGLLPKSGFDFYSFRRVSQIIFQDPYDSLNPKRTIYDSLVQAIKLVIKNEKPNSSLDTEKLSINLEQRAKEALEICDLVPAEAYLDRYPHELSGGERQRVSIARAISVNPIFLVADEPISMLDVSIRANILNLLKKLRSEKNMSILYISHDIASARYISDFIAVMYLGQIVEFGGSEEVIKNPLHPYTKALILSVPDIRPEWISRDFKIFGEIGNAINPEKRCRFYERCIYRKDICKEEEPPYLKVDQRYFKCHFTQSQLVQEEELLNET